MYLKRGDHAQMYMYTNERIANLSGCPLPQGGQDVSLGQEHFNYLLVRIAKPLQHVQGQLVRRRIQVFQREQQTSQRLRVGDYVVLQQLMQLIIRFPVYQRRDDQLVQVMLHGYSVLS